VKNVIVFDKKIILSIIFYCYTLYLIINGLCEGGFMWTSLNMMRASSNDFLASWTTDVLVFNDNGQASSVSTYKSVNSYSINPFSVFKLLKIPVNLYKKGVELEGKSDGGNDECSGFFWFIFKFVL